MIEIQNKDYEDKKLGDRSERSIESVVYMIEEAFKNGRPKPIVLIGAGASVSSGIPLAHDVVEDVMRKFKHKPEIKGLIGNEGYFEVMKRLAPIERNELLKSYIRNSKVNLTHLYLAQLLKESKIDYLLSVNFDDLILRASALHNFIPRFYDIANLRDLTTTNFPVGSVIFLHGLQYSSWLLNTDQEFERVGKVIPTLFSRICNDRTWILVGYSGQDPVLEHISSLGRFDNNLYWICYDEQEPNEIVKTKLLDKLDSNAFKVKKYNSDTFFAKLSKELKLPVPSIVNRPFSLVKSLFENIKDFDPVSSNSVEIDNQIASFRFSLDLSIKWIEDAIARYENCGPDQDLLQQVEINLESFQYKMTDCIAKQIFDIDSNLIMKFVNEKVSDFSELASLYFQNWATHLQEQARAEQDLSKLEMAFDKYDLALSLNSMDVHILINWGLAIAYKAEFMDDIELFDEAIIMFNKAKELDSKNPHSYFSCGTAYAMRAQITEDLTDIRNSISNFQRAVNIDPNDKLSLMNIGIYMFKLMIRENDLSLIKEAEDAFKGASKLDPNDDAIYFNWASSLYKLGNLTIDNNELLLKSLVHFKEAASKDPSSYKTYNNWGNALLSLGARTKDLKYFLECFDKFQKCTYINSHDIFAYTNWGNALQEHGKITNNITSFENAISKYEISFSNEPRDIVNLINWGSAISEIAKRREDVEMYFQSILKYEEAIEIDDTSSKVYLNWANSLLGLAEITKEEEYFEKCFDKYRRASELDGKNYVVFRNWGEALFSKANLLGMDQLLLDAEKMFEKAELINSSDSGLYNSWGVLLLHLSKGERQSTNLEKAKSMFKKSLNINPKFDIALFNWGLCLSLSFDKSKNIGDIKKAITLFNESLIVSPENEFLKKIKNLIRSSIKISYLERNIVELKNCFMELSLLSKENRNDNEILDIWVFGLIFYSKLLKLEERVQILYEAIEIAKEAMRIGSHCYNLACCCALLNRRYLAFAYLERALSDKYVSAMQVIEDEDWKEYLENEQFKDIIKKHKN